MKRPKRAGVATATAKPFEPVKGWVIYWPKHGILAARVFKTRRVAAAVGYDFHGNHGVPLRCAVVPWPYRPAKRRAKRKVKR